jgi:hypothetical protein
LRPDGRVVRPLEVAAAALKGGDDGGWHLVFEQWLGKPARGPDMN